MKAEAVLAAALTAELAARRKPPSAAALRHSAKHGSTYNQIMIDFGPRYAAYATHDMAQRLAALLAVTGTAAGGVRLAYLFGSQAREAATRDSDIDVAVSLGKPMQVADKELLIGEIGAAFGRPVDLIDLERCNGAILGKVFKEGIRLIDDPAVRERLAARRANWQTDVAPYLARLRSERRAAWLAHAG